jgi:fructokinase
MSDNALRPVVVLGEVLCDLLPPAPGVALQEAATLTPALGGAPANVAVQVARLGLPTALISAVGEEPLSARVLQTLAEEGVDTSAVIVRERGRLGLTLVAVDADGERAFFPWREGAADQTLSAQEIDEALVRRARCLVRGTVSMRSDAVRGATRRAVAVAHDAGVPVVLDVNLRRKMFAVESELLALARESVADAQVVKATREEAAAVLEAPDLDDEALIDGLLEAGPELVLLTLGHEGAWAATRRARVRLPAPDVHVVDATGAGDAFLGAATATLFAGEPPTSLARLGAPALTSLLQTANAAGAAACTALGATAGLLDHRQLPLVTLSPTEGP